MRGEMRLGTQVRTMKCACGSFLFAREGVLAQVSRASPLAKKVVVVNSPLGLVFRGASFLACRTVLFEMRAGATAVAIEHVQAERAFAQLRLPVEDAALCPAGRTRSHRNLDEGYRRFTIPGRHVERQVFARCHALGGVGRKQVEFNGGNRQSDRDALFQFDRCGVCVFEVHSAHLTR